MLVKKTIKCKVFRPTKKKFNLLEIEYQRLQTFLHIGRDEGLYSANKQQALRFYKKVKPEKEYPLSIRKDLIKVKRQETKLTKYWIRIPVSGQRGGVWLPVKPHCKIKESYEVCESKILKKGNNYFVHLTVQKEVEVKESYSSILSIDLGEKVIATTVLSSKQKPTFYGREIRGVRRHYAWLRKRLQKKKLVKKIKGIGHKEKRQVNDLLHKISRKIIDEAKENDSLILLGNLRGIRKNSKGKRFNRIVSNMPYHKLTKYIEHKAKWEGVGVIKIKENGTSVICSRCNSKGKRPYQGLFVCNECGYRVNADFNASKNILKRFWEYISKNGAPVNELETHPGNIKTTFSGLEDGMGNFRKSV